MKNSGDGSTDWGFLVCDQDQTAADAGYKRQTHPLPSIGHHAIWRMNMIQLKNRPFAGKVFSDVGGVTSCAVLVRFPTLTILLVEEESELVEVIAAASKSGYSFAKRKLDC